MITLALDKNNNLIVNGGLVATKSGDDAVVQDIKTLLQMFNTEYPFDNRVGIPYYDLASSSKETIQGTILERVKSDKRVLTARNIEINFVDGVASISLQVILKNGAVVNV